MITITTRVSADNLAKKIIETMRKDTIAGWVIDSENDMTLTSISWRNKSWMHIVMPKVGETDLTISIIGPANIFITNEVYAVYHSRFLEMLLRNFDRDILKFEVSSALTAGIDKCLNMQIR